MKDSMLIRLLGYICLVSAIISISDLIFYIPASADATFWIGKKILFAIAGAFLFWDIIVKPWLEKEKLKKLKTLYRSKVAE